MNNLLKKILILFFVIMSAILVYYFDNPTFHVSMIVFLVVYILINFKFEINHPYVWFTGFYCMYSISYTLAHIIEGNSIYGYSKQSTLFCLLGLFAFYLFGFSNKTNKNFTKTKNKFSTNVNINSQSIINIILLMSIMLVIATFYLQGLGITRKSDLVASLNPIFRISTYLTRFLSFYVPLLIFNSEDNKNYKYVLLSGISILMFSFFTAERDAIYRYVLVVFLASYHSQRIDKKKLPIYFIFGLLFVNFMSIFKYYFISGKIHESRNLIMDLIYGDFYAAGENFQLLLISKWTKSFFGLKYLFLDMIAPFTPFKTINTALWFNNTFYPGSSWSRAFTLTGQGYVLGGELGIFIIFSLLGWFSNFFYKRSKNSIYYASAYIYIISIIVSSFRGTVYSIVDASIKIPLLGIIILKIFHSILKRIKKKKFYL